MTPHTRFASVGYDHSWSRWRLGPQTGRSGPFLGGEKDQAFFFFFGGGLGAAAPGPVLGGDLPRLELLADSREFLGRSRPPICWTKAWLANGSHS